MSVLKNDTGRAVHLTDILKALAHPVRLRIVALLCEEDQAVGCMAERLGVKQTVVSQQLKTLRLNGLVEATRRKGFAVYSLGEPRLRELLKCLEGCPVDSRRSRKGA